MPLERSPSEPPSIWLITGTALTLKAGASQVVTRPR